MTDDNYWKHFGQGIDPSKNKYLNPLKVDVVSPPITSPQPLDTTDAKYFITDKFDTYALGVEAIRRIPMGTLHNHQHSYPRTDGSVVYRPFTMGETFKILIDDYNTLKDSNGQNRTLDDRLKLFKNYKYTSTGIAYQKKSNKIKIIPLCTQLADIPGDHPNSYLDIAYNALGSSEIDTSKNKYDKLLTETELLNHPAWLNALVDIPNPESLLKEMFKITTTHTKKDTAMAFWKISSSSNDQLRALYVSNIDYDSSANGNNNLNFSARFLQVAPSQKDLQRK